MFKANCILQFEIIRHCNWSFLFLDQAVWKSWGKNEEQCFNIPLLFHYFVICSHSDANLDNGTIKEDDKAVLLEGGQSKSPSTKFRNLSTKANLIRYCLND